jgi:hypothetical protein
MLNKIIEAKTEDLILLHNGEAQVIGGIFKKLDLELEDGSTIEVNCVYFNLALDVSSTDFFLFNAENHKLVSYSIGLRTDPFFKKMYLKILARPSNHLMKVFVDEFVGEYVVQGLLGTFP